MNTETTRIHRTVSVLLAGLLLPVLTHAAALWPSVKYGMSVPQVVVVLPQSKQASGQRKLFSGAIEMLSIDNVSLVGKTFTARLFFSDGLLVQVLLSPPEWDSNQKNIVVFEELTRAFSAKYGRDFDRSVSARASGLSASAEWIKDGENVFISVIPVTQETSMLKVGFRPVSQIPPRSRK